jgi:hypothetical protein
LTGHSSFHLYSCLHNLADATCSQLGRLADSADSTRRPRRKDNLRARAGARAATGEVCLKYGYRPLLGQSAREESHISPCKSMFWALLSYQRQAHAINNISYRKLWLCPKKANLLLQQYISVNHKSNVWARSPYQSSNTAATGSRLSASQSVKCQPFQRVRPLRVQSSWLCTLAPSWTRSWLNDGTITDGVETESASCSFLFVYSVSVSFLRNAR